MIITLSNLYPRPDQPTRGLYNYYLFREMERIVNGYRLSVIGETDNQQPITNNHYLNICLVPEWRVWRWPAIRRWEAVEAERDAVGSEALENGPPATGTAAHRAAATYGTPREQRTCSRPSVRGGRRVQDR